MAAARERDRARQTAASAGPAKPLATFENCSRTFRVGAPLVPTPYRHVLTCTDPYRPVQISDLLLVIAGGLSALRIMD